MYKTTLKTYLEIKKTIEASKPEILPYMLQIKLFNVKASSVKFGGSRETKLPFQILQVKSANRAQGDGAFQTSIARGQLDTKKLGICGQQLSTCNCKTEFPTNGYGAVILKAACPELLVCIPD